MIGLQEAIISLAAVLITGFVTNLTAKATKYFKEKGILAKFEAKKESVTIAVNAVEQIAAVEDVPNKFNEAQRRAVHLLNEQGIQITDAELKSLIEAAVLAVQKGYEENK